MKILIENYAKLLVQMTMTNLFNKILYFEYTILNQNSNFVEIMQLYMINRLHQLLCHKQVL